jgi:divalent metal cation (Fe/Co/Zn/Cd) transporter
MLAVLGALFANGLITVLKFIAAVMTGSSGMMAESLHSLADTTNQVFLLLGLRFYKRPASEKHPFGYGKERFFGSFIASITIGVVLAIVAFVLARSSRGLLLGEAATAKCLARIREALRSHPNVVEVVELLTMHLAPKQILVNAHINFRDELATDDIERTVHEVEALIKKAEPKVDMIFLETTRESGPGPNAPIPQHMG